MLHRETNRLTPAGRAAVMLCMERLRTQPATRKARPLASRAWLFGVRVAVVAGVLCGAVLLIGGCKAPEAVTNAYVQYVNATAPEYRAYVRADANLDDAAKARRFLAIDTAEELVRTLEKAP
jgi:hypothetical protein